MFLENQNLVEVETQKPNLDKNWDLEQMHNRQLDSTIRVY